MDVKHSSFATMREMGPALLSPTVLVRSPKELTSQFRLRLIRHRWLKQPVPGMRMGMGDGDDAVLRDGGLAGGENAAATPKWAPTDIQICTSTTRKRAAGRFLFGSIKEIINHTKNPTVQIQVRLAIGRMCVHFDRPRGSRGSWNVLPPHGIPEGTVRAARY
jgi:hypothetical protein